MTDPNIVDLIAKTVAAKQQAEASLLEVDQFLMPGRQALKNAAAQSFRDLFFALGGVIGQYTGGIFVHGPGAVKFSELAEDEGPSLTLDAAEMYVKVAAEWFPTVRVDKVFALDCLPAFLTGVNKILSALGVRSIAPAEFGKYFGRPIQTIEEATNLSREILREVVGDDLNGLYLNNRLAEKVVETEWDLKIVPAVILNTTSEEAAGELFRGLFYGRNILVKVNENVQMNDLVHAFRHVKQQFAKPGDTDVETSVVRRKYIRKNPPTQE